MASPQVENGFLQIANELTHRFARLKLSGREWQIIWALWGKTWAWHKKDEYVTLSEFGMLTGLSRKKCGDVITLLEQKNIVNKFVPKNGDKRIRCYCFNKDYDSWKLSPNSGTNKFVPKNGDRLSPNSGTDRPQKRGQLGDLTPHHASENGTPKETPININKETPIGSTTEDCPQIRGQNADKPKKSRKKPSVPLPPDFKLTSDHHVYAVGKGMPDHRVSLEWEHFIETHKKKDSHFSDWNAAWKTWVLNWVKWDKGKESGGDKGGYDEFLRRHGEARKEV
jgi:phage replication O-like protein O